MYNRNKYLKVNSSGGLVLIDGIWNIVFATGERAVGLGSSNCEESGLEVDNNRVTLESLRRVAPEWADKVEAYEKTKGNHHES